MAGGELAVTLNGEGRTLPGGTTVAQLLAEITPPGAPPGESRGGRCAVEVNRAIVPRSSHGAHILQDGDVIEVVTFVGGG